MRFPLTRGGIHPPAHKEDSTVRPIAAVPLPGRLVIPLRQHNGPAAVPCIEPGQRVGKGACIGAAHDPLAVAVHAPTSGTVRALVLHDLPSPDGARGACVVLEPDGEDRWAERTPLDWRAADPARVRERLRDLGLAGLGGAVFPTHAKLGDGTRAVDTLVINGAECEPFITCDDMLMRERAAEVTGGASILGHLLAARSIVVAVENNKPEALAALQAVAPADVKVVSVPTVYPSGAARQLILLVTGIELPEGSHSLSHGVQCFNAGTAAAAWRALVHGEPVVTRILTLAGNVDRPGNVAAPLGMLLSDLMRHAGARHDTTGHIMGGPLMGFPLPSLDVPVVKAMNCIIAATPRLLPARPPAMPCIRCGRCATACPAGLQPHDLHWFLHSNRLDRAASYHIRACIECGACDHVCPSDIPLAASFRRGKAALRELDDQARMASSSRLRYTFRQARLERDARETADRLRAAERPLSASPGGSQPEAVQAALERARARRRTGPA